MSHGPLVEISMAFTPLEFSQHILHFFMFAFFFYYHISISQDFAIPLIYMGKMLILKKDLLMKKRQYSLYISNIQLIYFLVYNLHIFHKSYYIR